MTTVENRPATSGAQSGAEVQKAQDLVSLTIDGLQISVPKGTLIIRAAEQLGIAIPRFCDHPLLDPVGACRQCLVEIPDAGNGRGMPKPAASCTTTVAEGMVVQTQLTSAAADKAQQGVMELLLINHPLDCPVCDKGGECPLQNQAMSNGAAESRFDGVKRTYPKPIHISAQVLLDRERCVLCARCTRFSAQVAGDPFIELMDRGALQQVGIYESQPFESYFSGNTVQICPVGALTGAQYRFRARPFDLVSSEFTCEHCASGCTLRADHRRGKVLRRWAAVDPEVNEEWNCDKGRWAFQYAQVRNANAPTHNILGDRVTEPMVRDEHGRLVPTSWPDALDVAARGLRSAQAAGGVGVLAGGRLTVEDAYAYGKFARAVLDTNDVDFRARPHSAEEESFLASVVAGRRGVTYAELEAAPVVLLVGFEPEEESPIVFLRLRKGVRKNGVAVFGVAPYSSRGLQKLSGTLIPAVPGEEPVLLGALAGGSAGAWPTASRDAAVRLSELLRTPGAVVVVGERLATVPGAFSAAMSLTRATGARVAWVPRRAGERGALDVGLLPSVLPGGRPVSDAGARVDTASAWGLVGLPTTPGRDTAGMLDAVRAGALAGLVVGGVELEDLPDPHSARVALEGAGFVLSLEVRTSEVTDRADVVLPVAPPVERAGTYVDWEGRQRPFDAVLKASVSMTDGRVLDRLAGEMDVRLGLPDVATTQRELRELGAWEGVRAAEPEEQRLDADVSADRTVPVHPRRTPPRSGEAVLATWRQLLDLGRMQDGEPFLAATAKAAVARISAGTAQEVGVAEGEHLTVRSAAEGAAPIVLPVVITDMPDRVVWLPTNSPGSRVLADLRAQPGDVVTISGGAS